MTSRYVIYRVTKDRFVEWVDEHDGPTTQDTLLYIEGSYMHDSAEGERYFITDPLTGKVMGQWKVALSKRMESTTGR